jgi:hypothetical protein
VNKMTNEATLSTSPLHLYDKSVPVQGSGGTAPRILNLGPIWR